MNRIDESWVDEILDHITIDEWALCPGFGHDPDMTLRLPRPKASAFTIWTPWEEDGKFVCRFAWGSGPKENSAGTGQSIAEAMCKAWLAYKLGIDRYD